MDEFKISQTEIDNNNVKSAADLLKGDPKDNKNVFDRLPELIAERFNSFVENVSARLNDCYTKSTIDARWSVLDGRIENVKGRFEQYYTKTETYTKSEVDTKNKGLANTLTYSINQKADAYNVYTRAETDSAIAEAVAGVDSGIVTVKGTFTAYDEENALKGTAELTETEIKAHIDNGENVVLLVKDESGKFGYPLIAQYDGYTTALMNNVLGLTGAIFVFYSPASGERVIIVVDEAGNLSGGISYCSFAPKATVADAGKFLRVNDGGGLEWQTVESAEGVGF